MNGVNPEIEPDISNVAMEAGHFLGEKLIEAPRSGRPAYQLFGCRKSEILRKSETDAGELGKNTLATRVYPVSRGYGDLTESSGRNEYIRL